MLTNSSLCSARMLQTLSSYAPGVSLLCSRMQLGAVLFPCMQLGTPELGSLHIQLCKRTSLITIKKHSSNLAYNIISCIVKLWVFFGAKVLDLQQSALFF